MTDTYFGSSLPVRILVAIVVAGSIPADAAAPPRLPSARAEEAGMDSRRFVAIDRAVEEGLAARQMPGCVVLLGRHGKMVFQKAYGSRQVLPERIPISLDTVFDRKRQTRASLTPQVV